jgi:putative IMPACT (imprinted ancient) family translation regulator
VVVRYFGGVKLGAGGLVRAYSAAVSEAVNHAELKQVTPSVKVKIIVDFAKETKIRHIVNQYQGQILDVSYAVAVNIYISLAIANVEQFSRQVINETAGNAVITCDD